jgi:hypothetical protein
MQVIQNPWLTAGSGIDPQRSDTLSAIQKIVNSYVESTAMKFQSTRSYAMIPITRLKISQME